MSTRRIVAVASLALIAVATGCSDRSATPFTPEREPVQLEVVSPPVIALPLKRLHALPNDITRSITLSGTGGVINIPEAGFHLNVPKNAIIGMGKITITVTALAGDMVAYEFSPHGTVFKYPVKLTQDLAVTSWHANEGRTDLEAAYFKSVDDIDLQRNEVVAYEFLPVVFASGDRLHFDVKHFSGYLVSTGRHR
jgi:hypothetical protein